MSNEKEEFYKPIELICGICGQKDKDIYFWEGFDAAIDLVKKYMENSDVILMDQLAQIMDDIDDEVELYKKGG